MATLRRSRTVLLSWLCLCSASLADEKVTDSSPLRHKATYLQKDLIGKHLLEGLYVSLVPVLPAGQKPRHSVDEPGNVIHAGVWTGRYLAGVGYQYAVTKDPQVRVHGGELLRGLRVLQEVTGKPGLLARGYVKGHGPVAGWERNGSDSREWHQGQGKYADYRWYGDVSVDNFNAVLYGYAIYYDLAADDEQKRFIAHDVDRLMTHLLDNHCRIIDVDGEVTRYGHVGIDPDPAREEYYRKQYAPFLARLGRPNETWRPSLRSSLMLLPDLLIAHRITANPRYADFYKRVVSRFKDNPDRLQELRKASPRRTFVDHSSEGQSYEALYNLVRYETSPELLKHYRQWVTDLWEVNWMEGNSLFTFMTLALLPEYRAPPSPRAAQTVPHGEEGLRLALETLKFYPVDRVCRPVMNSLRKDITVNPAPGRGGAKLAAKPLPINQRPLDNEYEWKGNPYRLDGWFKPTVTAIQFACDDPQVAWFCDNHGRIYMTRDGGKEWQDVSTGLMGTPVQNIAASKDRTFVLHAQTGKGIFITRDGGLSWRPAPSDDKPAFPTCKFNEWQGPGKVKLRINDQGELVRKTDGAKTEAPCMMGWPIPRCSAVFATPWGIVASGLGGAYRTDDGEHWTEMKLWPDQETGAADFLHAYWMGRYYGFVAEGD